MVRKQRSKLAQEMVNDAVMRQKKYLDLRRKGKPPHEAAAACGMKDSPSYEAMFEMQQGAGPHQLERYFAEWLENVPDSIAVPARAQRYMAAYRRKQKPSVVAPAQVTIPEVMDKVKNWHEKIKRVQSILEHENTEAAIDTVIDSLSEIVNVLASIKEIINEQ